MHKPFLVSNNRNPFEIFLLVACVFGGVGGFIDPSRASSVILEAVPRYILIIWYLAIAIGGTITLVGLLGKKLIFLFLERLGLVLLTGFSLGYSIILLTHINRPLALSALITLSFSIACLVRLIQVSRELQRGPQ